VITAAGTGSVVDRLGVRLRAVSGADAAALLGVAVRRNPLRAHLLVSRVLGKHVPADPRTVRAAGLLLGLLVADALADRPARPLPTDRLHAAAGGDGAAGAALHAGLAPEGPTDALVLGFAETATALGHCVAEALSADYLHSTRRAVPGVAPAGGFTEEHSHATAHDLLPADPAILRGDRPLVLVDDELSTGRTALNTIAALHRAAPRRRYVLAALVDARPPGSDLVAAVAALGARLDVVALATARVELPADVIARAAQLRTEVDRRADGNSNREGDGAQLPSRDPVAATGDGPAPAADVRALVWPAGLPVGGRHGVAAADHAPFAAAVAAAAAALDLDPAERTLVLGTEELMHLPLRLAQCLADARGGTGAEVRFSTTTRSPAVVVDEPDYALRTGLRFPAHDDPADGPGHRYAYNVAAPDRPSAAAGGPGWDRIVVVVDPPGDTPALRSGLLAALAPHARRTTVLVTP
jgi:phosphoribosyl transferase-like protein/phosphoribosyltransferase-like predicted ribonucleoside biosynthesis protein